MRAKCLNSNIIESTEGAENLQAPFCCNMLCHGQETKAVDSSKANAIFHRFFRGNIGVDGHSAAVVLESSSDSRILIRFSILLAFSPSGIRIRDDV